MPSTLLHTFLLCIISNGVAEFRDELTVYEKECLGEDKFHCGQSQCIWSVQHCDGTVDCDNGADETFCVIHMQNGTCRPYQFPCADGKQCIPAIWECNNISDCDDRSDEANCTALPVSHNGTCGGFTCGDGKCVSRLWACDGAYDCADKSDEMPAACKHSRPLSYDPSRCSTPIHSRGQVPKECEDKSYCLPEAMFCDGMKDCKDGSDEGVFCLHWQNMCVNHSCGNDTKAFCAPEPKGPKCYCENAATYNTSTKLCETIDLCAEARPYCGHKCEFLNGPMQFKCSCDDGYTIDKLGIAHACFAPEPEALLFFSTSNTVGYIKLRSKQTVTLLHTKQARGVASDGTHVFWVESSEGHEAIARADLNDVNNKMVLVGLGLEDPSEIAVDWQGGHIYFSDAERGVISVCRTNGVMCTTLNTDTRVPKFVTLDPNNGKMYWSDWHGVPVIVRADMAGRNAAPLPVTLTASPTGLALDAPAQRLYYVDGTVRGINLRNMKVFTLFDEQMYHPSALSVFENTVYWSDWASSTIQACDKATGQPTDQTYKFDTSVMGMHIYHPIAMRSRHNPCAAANCSHFCFVTSDRTHMCGCPDGYKLENAQCTHKIKDYRPTYLVVGGGARFTRIQYNAFGAPESEATTFDIGRVQAMAYDSHRDTLYIYDGERKTINSVPMTNFTSGRATMVLYKGLDNVVDMDYDHVTDCLYILDVGHHHKRIEVVSLRTMKQALVYRFIDGTPISFCLLPDYGTMLVAVSENDVIYIDRLGLDGSGRRHVVTNDLKGPHISLRYSRNIGIVYIADEGNHIIETMHPEGTARETYKELSRTVISLAVTDNLVQWSGRSPSHLYWADAHEVTPRIRRVDLASFPNTTYLHLQSTYPAPINYSHPCDEKKCSDICVQTTRGQNGSLKGQNGSLAYICKCPAGLLDLGGICTEAPSCKEYEAYCHLSNMCVHKRWLCDGKHDCIHGEDEDDCSEPIIPKKASLCGDNEVECNSHCIHKDTVCNPKASSIATTCTTAEYLCATDGVCIERSQMCNGVSDCLDGSDESTHLCNTLTCLHTEFLCSSGACILNSLRCDGEEDCSDGSDEINCARKTCPTGHFQCRNSECVEMKRRCDHHSDCTDYSDEEDCVADDVVDNQEPVESCAAWEHTCELNSSVCIPLTARCNGKVDCPGSTDESNCDDRCAPKGLFECKQEGHCLTRDKLCNGNKDCTDGSDERPMVCSRVNRTSRVYTIHYFPAYECRSGYMCDSGQCIEWRDVCDHQPNCFDGTDESPLCFTACENHACAHKCQPTPKGPTCQCSSGFELSPDRKTCRDIDECEEATEPCSQRCINIAGSFLCACYRGYALRTDRRSCKAVRDHMAVLYVTDNSVRSLTADGQPGLEFNDPTVSRVTGIDCDVRRRKLYVTSADARKLIEVNSTKNEVTVTNVGTPTKVAVDWISGNVYFVDSALPSSYIRVCDVEKKRCAKLQRLPAQSITTALVIDPASRLMFYCITHEQESIIWSATLGGGQVRDVATVHNCTGLAVDSFKRRLYVAQTGPASITRMDFNGGRRTKIVQNDMYLDAPHGLAVFEDHIYYLVANSLNLNRCLLYGERNCEVYLQRMFNANTFVIRHESTQRDDLLHICDAYKCDNICVMDADGPVCLCDNGTVAIDGSCPLLGKDQLPLFNGVTAQDHVTSSRVSHTLLISVLAIIALYLIVFVYYRCVYKKRARRNDNYVPVHFTNSMTEYDRCSPFTSPLTPQVAIGNGEFLNPFSFMRDVWRSSQRMPSKTTGEGVKIDVAQLAAGPANADVSDTESDIDDKETRFIIRRK